MATVPAQLDTRPAGVVAHPAAAAGELRHDDGRLRPVLPSPEPKARGSKLVEELRGTVVRARELVLTARRRLPEAPFPTGLPGLDELLGGGLARGELVELVGARSCGRMAAVLAALASATGCGEPAALVDQGDHLDPRSAATAGVDLERLLWLRPERLRESLEMAEMLLQTGFPLVVVDLGLPPVRGRVSAAAWMRVARTATAHRSAVLLSSPYHLSRHSAAAVLRLGGGHGRWAGSRGGLRLLEGLPLSCTVIRRRGERPGAHARDMLTVAEAPRPRVEAPDPQPSPHFSPPRGCSARCTGAGDVFSPPGARRAAEPDSAPVGSKTPPSPAPPAPRFTGR